MFPTRLAQQKQKLESNTIGHYTGGRFASMFGLEFFPLVVELDTCPNVVQCHNKHRQSNKRPDAIEVGTINKTAEGSAIATTLIHSGVREYGNFGAAEL